MEVVQKELFMAIKIMRLMEMLKLEQVDAGTCGKTLQNKILALVTQKNSAQTFQRQIGNLQQ